MGAAREGRSCASQSDEARSVLAGIVSATLQLRRETWGTRGARTRRNHAWPAHRVVPHRAPLGPNGLAVRYLPPLSPAPAQMWEEEQKRKAEALAKGWNPDADGEEEEEAGAARDDDDLPFACFLCREAWEQCKTPPVVTRCKHYFCEKCALK